MFRKRLQEPAVRDRSRSRSPRRGDRAAPDGEDESEEEKPKRRKRQDATFAKVVAVGDFYGNIDVRSYFFRTCSEYTSHPTLSICFRSLSIAALTNASPLDFSPFLDLLFDRRGFRLGVLDNVICKKNEKKIKTI